MNEDLHNPQFWAIVSIGLFMVGLFIYWLRTGARKPLRNVPFDGDSHLCPGGEGGKAGLSVSVTAHPS